MTPFEIWQLEKYGNYIPDNEPEEEIIDNIKTLEDEEITNTSRTS